MFEEDNQSIEEYLCQKYGIVPEPDLTEEDDYINGEEVDVWALSKS